MLMPMNTSRQTIKGEKFSISWKVGSTSKPIFAEPKLPLRILIMKSNQFLFCMKNLYYPAAIEMGKNQHKHPYIDNKTI